MPLPSRFVAPLPVIIDQSLRSQIWPYGVVEGVTCFDTPLPPPPPLGKKRMAICLLRICLFEMQA